VALDVEMTVVAEEVEEDSAADEVAVVDLVADFNKDHQHKLLQLLQYLTHVREIS